MQQTPGCFADTCMQNNQSKNSGETSQAVTGGIAILIFFDIAYKDMIF
jgi:hypothetical protein